MLAVVPTGATLVPTVVAVERLPPFVAVRVSPEPRNCPLALPVAFKDSVPVNLLTDVKCVGIPLLARSMLRRACSFAMEARASLYSTPNRWTWVGNAQLESIRVPDATIKSRIITSSPPNAQIRASVCYGISPRASGS
ncbi:hypothetical protein [Sphingomonas faeni]|uniref:hypothetical protein n=1 Tax=Sphingomonas faeni TaxID=185950 RepID=UPI003364FBDF